MKSFKAAAIMKKLILPLFASITFAANAQFSIQPQVGMETLRTTIKSSDFSAFFPMGMQIAPALADVWLISSKQVMVHF
ncbi:MAG: hypothetical protein WKG06_36315 [Segetibacter sp.]